MTPHQNDAAMREHLLQWQRSGLTQAAYCKKHAVKPHIFSYYKKKFSPVTETANPSSQLVPVKLVADEESSSSNLIRVTHANGFSLEIHPNTEVASLKPLLELVRSVS